MDRQTAFEYARNLLNEYGLAEWRIAFNTDGKVQFLGLCDFKSQTIILSRYGIELSPDIEVMNTIKHEIAHALVGPNNGHNQKWADKALLIGAHASNCAHYSIPEHVIDAIRSGQNVEMVVETVHIPKYRVTRLQEKCPDCGKVAIEKFSVTVLDNEGNECKLITLACFHIIKKIIPKATPFESLVSNGWKDEVKTCKHEWNKHECAKCGEFRLMPFQIIGARKAEISLAQQKGFGIFDDMGLGKTVQALALLKFHKEYTPCLVVTKSAIKFQWFKQIIRWLGPDYLSQIISTSRDFLYPGLKTYIIPYDLLRRFPRAKLDKIGFKMVILDECQQIKNPDSTRTQEVRRLLGDNGDCKVLPLSGTPWKNRGGEYFPVLNMMDPIKFYSYQQYLDNWVEYYYEGAKKKMGGIKSPKKFREYTDGLLIRREFEEVIEDFPIINRMKLNVQLDELQQSTYDESVSEFVKWYNEATADGGEEKLNGLEILAKMSRMRHITGLAKMPATLEFIQEFAENTSRKLVIFVHHQDVGELMYSSLTNLDKESNKEWHELAEYLKENGIKVFKYTAAYNDAERFKIQESFNSVPRAFMVASTIACGEGVDLQSCADGVMHERQWNPQNEDQALPGRFRRIGQLSKQINGTFPEAEGTIDEHLDWINERKRRQYHQVMNKSEVPAWSQDSMAKELATLIIKKHQEKKAKSGQTQKTSITKVAAY